DDPTGRLARPIRPTNPTINPDQRAANQPWIQGSDQVINKSMIEIDKPGPYMGRRCSTPMTWDPTTASMASTDLDEEGVLKRKEGGSGVKLNTSAATRSGASSNQTGALLSANLNNQFEGLLSQPGEDRLARPSR
ncbi:hypothetical protein U1Q18_013727, partial [Sarracenia purpurea var. burkii]